MTRRVCYLTGTRADFGLMRSTLERAHADRRLSVELVVTGMHLEPRFGSTVAEVEASRLPIRARIPVDMSRSDGLHMAESVGTLLAALARELAHDPPDVLLLLGDRGEMLAAAIAAVHLNLPVAHLHGGERSGTIDESLRHAISKLAHWHFAATECARQRLVRMGERADRVFVTGAPGLDGLASLACIDRARLCREAGLDASRPVALAVFHPVVQQMGEAGEQADALLDALDDTGVQAMVLLPNADAGGDAIRASIARRGDCAGARSIATHLPRARFVSWMAAADLMLGNSSSGIIEAATFRLPVVNVGDRQRGRERGPNVVDVPARRDAIAGAIRAALFGPRPRAGNPWGDGRAGERIVELLATLPAERDLLEKLNAY
jgi:GDP/UDP-N,N'-diacetylbacillosamine 2-epimerase (hydrolysing)